jgi:hypothetical protein
LTQRSLLFIVSRRGGMLRPPNWGNPLAPAISSICANRTQVTIRNPIQIPGRGLPLVLPRFVKYVSEFHGGRPALPWCEVGVGGIGVPSVKPKRFVKRLPELSLQGFGHGKQTALADCHVIGLCALRSGFLGRTFFVRLGGFRMIAARENHRGGRQLAVFATERIRLFGIQAPQRANNSEQAGLAY